MASVLLGVDVGTSSVKVGLFDADGRLLGLGRAHHSVDSPQPGWAQCDPEHWWKGLLTALAAAREVAGVQAPDIGGVGLGVLFPCVVPMDERGPALYPAILYCDRRSLAQPRGHATAR